VPSFGDFASGATGGAIAGSSFGPPGAIVGGIIGGISSLFGESAAEKRAKRYEDVKNFIADLRMKNEQQRRRTLNEGITRLSRYGGSLISSARSSGAQIAASHGIADPTSFIAPREQRATTAAGEGITRYATDTNARFDAQNFSLDRYALSAAMENANAPIEPSVGDTLLTAGSAIGSYTSARDYIKTLEGATMPHGYTPSTNVMGGSGAKKSGGQYVWPKIDWPIGRYGHGVPLGQN